MEAHAIAGLVFGYVSFLLGFVVMAVLAGLLLPALSKAKSKAQEIKCVNNLKQIGLAARMYSNDHADTFPTNFAALESYLGDASILICPADSQHVPLAVRDFNQLGPSNISYQFLLPGAKESDVNDQVVFLCPIHGNSGMGDGSVQQGRPR
jgi:type II secretory pathway pseudopilin PulG